MNHRWLNPTGVVLKIMTPCEQEAISSYLGVSSPCLQDPDEFELFNSSAGVPLKQKSGTRFNLWPFWNPLTTKSRCTGQMQSFLLTPALCLRNSPFLRWACMQDPPHFYDFNGVQTLSDCWFKRLGASHGRYFLKQEAGGSYCERRKRGNSVFFMFLTMGP